MFNIFLDIEVGTTKSTQVLNEIRMVETRQIANNAFNQSVMFFEDEYLKVVLCLFRRNYRTVVKQFRLFEWWTPNPVGRFQINTPRLGHAQAFRIPTTAGRA